VPVPEGPDLRRGGAERATWKREAPDCDRRLTPVERKDATRPEASGPAVSNVGLEAAPGNGGGDLDSGRFGHFAHAVAGQDFGLGTQPILLSVSGLAATFFVEFVGALPDFILKNFRVRRFHGYLPYEFCVVMQRVYPSNVAPVLPQG
jgi:hypothetical protein